MLTQSSYKKEALRQGMGVGSPSTESGIPKYAHGFLKEVPQHNKQDHGGVGSQYR